MRGRPARCRQLAGVDVTTAGRPTTIAAAALSVAVLLVGALSPTVGDTGAARSTSGLTTMTSPDTWWTMNEPHPDGRSILRRRSSPPRLRHRHHRHRQRNRPIPISGFDSLRPHSGRSATDNATTSGRRRFRHVDDKSTSGSDVFKVVVDPRPSDKNNPEAEAGGISGWYFRFCRHRLITSAMDPVRCGGSSEDVARRCLAELAALDDEAEAKFQQFADVMAFFDCGHSYSLASGCQDCEVKNIPSSNSSVINVTARILFSRIDARCVLVLYSSPCSQINGVFCRVCVSCARL